MLCAEWSKIYPTDEFKGLVFVIEHVFLPNVSFSETLAETSFDHFESECTHISWIVFEQIVYNLDLNESTCFHYSSKHCLQSSAVMSHLHYNDLDNQVKPLILIPYI
ncbi:uncharacterized protein LOC111088368 [Limulus polyphemus]|uniref:Uncharacterized protein LOC111088368 n=1 Tax=Limulus polyphemus TaxID=6850 RepID=A0ABM1TDN9_LIMPO|nr:uncharacterized protein LOC111088368 [Limulus polyphemus]